MKKYNELEVELAVRRALSMDNLTEAVMRELKKIK